jgi:hypothetical protein
MGGLSSGTESHYDTAGLLDPHFKLEVDKGLCFNGATGTTTPKSALDQKKKKATGGRLNETQCAGL